MRPSLVLDYRMLERLTSKPQYENIIIGTGVLACDMREKLRLLGLNATYLVGEYSDPANQIIHYDAIANLGDPKKYRFIVCCDIDQWTLSAPAQIAAYKFLGNAAPNHPQMIRLSNGVVSRADAGNEVVDAGNCNIVLNNGLPYLLYEGEKGSDTFSIHVLGSCHAGGIVRYDRETYPEILQRELKHLGFHAAVYAWGQPVSPVSDAVITFIRDAALFRADMVILYHTNTWDSIRFSTKNILATRAGGAAYNHPFIKQLGATYHEKISDGIDHEIDSLTIVESLGRMFAAYSRLYGFAFWNIIPPTNSVLPEEQAIALHKLSSGYFSRQRKKKDEVLTVLGSRYAKDYSDTFANIEDVYSMFADYGHLSSEGNRLIAQRCAKDILAEFGKSGR